MSYEINNNITRPAPVGVAAAAAATPPVPDATPKEVANAVASVLAAASVQAEATGSLGDPKTFRYPDGSGRVALYRMPRGTPKGTCIFIHGCKHDPYSWFYKSKRCPLCTGLPEEVSHTKQCLARGYAVLALMSINREYRSRCFASSGTANDQPSAAQTIQQWSRAVKLNKKPMYMFGVSSGASFAIKFPGVMRIQGVISEVNMPDVAAWNMVDQRTKLFKKPMPPTVYYQMERDVKTAKQIAEAVKVFRKNRVPVGVVYAPKLPVTNDFLYKRSVYLSREQSAQIAFYLRKIGVLDANGFVKYDVRLKRGWIKQLPMFLPWLKRSDPYYNLISDESQIWQSLNLAWAWHEIISDFVRPTLEWLEKRGKADLDALVKKYDLKGNLRCLTERREGCPRRG